MTEIRSYRRVFDLERRIYSVDRLRLNPAGVPIRGVLYFLAAVSTTLFIGRLPVLGAALVLLPWFLRDLALPAILAAALTAIRIDGRTFHQAAGAAGSFWATPRRSVALGRPFRGRPLWSPGEIMFLPDGSEAELRPFRYLGPGKVAIFVGHRQVRDRRRLLATRGRQGTRLLAAPRGRRLRRARVIEIDARTSVIVDLDRGHEQR